MNFVSSYQLSCDPFDSGTNSDVVQAATNNPECVCTYPCTVDKVDDFVRLYFIKRFVSDMCI